MINYIAERLLYSFLLLFFISILIFVLARLMPGDPIQAASMVNINLANKEIIENLREEFGLNKPLYAQYLFWLKNFIQGDWGTSFGSGEKVLTMFMRCLPVTLELFLASMFWSTIIGFPFGIISALKRNSWLDVCFSTSAVVGVSIPVFWESIVFIYIFGVYFPILPPSGYIPFSDSILNHFLCLLMPGFVMGTHGAGLLSRYIRSCLLDVLSQDYIRTARAKGLSEIIILARHAAKPALIPVTTIIGLSWSYVIVGSFFVEYIFALPGLGRMGANAIFARDFPVIQATLFIAAINIISMNLIIDIIYGFLDPRVKVNATT
ncbi:peptide ABC transporter permease [Candidatus Magnetomorum sp. HK-1]|nr:peptide ABC transporter permease [Candidatus Magnetomorum sp. HK-1]